MAASTAAGRELTVPLRLDHAFVQRILLDTIYTGEGDTTEAMSDVHGCNRVVLSEPSVGGRDGRLVVRTRTRAQLGAWMGRCMVLHSWEGTIEIHEEPRVDPAAPLIRFHVVDSNVEAAGGGKGVTGSLWDLVKSSVHPRMEAMVIDLREPLAELGQVLPLFLSQEDLSRTRLLLNSLSFTSARVVDDGLAVDLRMDLSELPPQPVVEAGPEPTLTVEELARWDAAWQQWDAFLTFTVLRLARDPHSEQQLQELRDVFLTARYDLARALRAEPGSDADPVRRLFLRTWTRLRPLLRELSLGLPGEVSLRYLSLIAAADALQAIDQVGPDVGVEISADGLRRLARLLDPVGTDDPLYYDTEVNPELREMLGLGTPLPEPPPIETETPGPDESGGDGGLGLLDWLVPRAAADEKPEGEAAKLSARLRGWAPTRDDVAQYLPLALRILDLSRERILAKRRLAEEFHPLFRTLLLATAWQESCWRQFVHSGGAVKTITSSAGSIGVMQVNQHVWRGIYNVRWLRDDIAYNALAGSEILLHYLVDYAIKKGEHTATGNPDNLARASYAVFNGGPGHLRRYRNPPKNKHLRDIDASFWNKYKEVKSGNDLAVRECYG